MDCPRTYQAVLEYIGPSHINLVIDSIYTDIYAFSPVIGAPHDFRGLLAILPTYITAGGFIWYGAIWCYGEMLCQPWHRIYRPAYWFVFAWMANSNTDGIYLLGCEIHVKCKSRVDDILGVVGSVAICHFYLTSFTAITWKRFKCCFIDIKWVVSDQGRGLLIQFFSLPLFSDFFNVIKTHVSHWISCSYLSGAATIHLQWDMPNMNVI